MPAKFFKGERSMDLLIFIKEHFELVVFFLLVPTTLLSTAVAIITIRAQWRSFLEAVGVKFFLTIKYTRRKDGKVLDARDLWEGTEPLRVLRAGIGSQAKGYYVKGAEYKTDPKRCGGTFWNREFEAIVMVDDLTRGPVGPSYFDPVPTKPAPKPILFSKEQMEQLQSLFGS